VISGELIENAEAPIGYLLGCLSRQNKGAAHRIKYQKHRIWGQLHSRVSMAWRLPPAAFFIVIILRPPKPVSGVAQWLGRRSLAGWLSPTCACSVVDRWPLCA